MDTTPVTDEKKGVHHLTRCDMITQFLDLTLLTCIVRFAPGQKDEKESGKTEEAGKLPNGESAKDSAAAALAEERKKAKTRFMFNIADGGFTGKISC